MDYTDYIITPTFSGHFQYIKAYLDSFCQYVEDPENVIICFTISEVEEEKFDKLVLPYKEKCNIEVCLFENLLEEFGSRYTSDELMERYGKFTFQTFKKFLTILHLRCKRSLILDSESMWINLTNMRKLFDDFFTEPFITVSNIAGRQWDLFTEIEISNINQLLNIKCIKWPLENFMWFYDYDILTALFREYGDLNQMAESIFWKNCGQPFQPGIFEILLYQEYIYINAERFGYSVIEIDEEIKKVLDKKTVAHYTRKMLDRYNCAGGFAEHMSEHLTEANRDALAQVMKDNRQWIIRCDRSASYRMYKIQKPFMEAVKPNILAASQEHYFGLNQSLIKILQKTLKGKLFELGAKLKHFGKRILLKCSPAYKTSSDVRDNISRLGDAMNWRMGNIERMVTVELERRLSGYPNMLSDLQYKWNLNVCRSIIAQMGAEWFPGKRVMVVDGAYGDVAMCLQEAGADVTMTERRGECCAIAQERLRPNSNIILLATEHDFYHIKECNRFDLIVDLGMIHYDEMPFIYSWMHMTDQLMFGVRTCYWSKKDLERFRKICKHAEKNVTTGISQCEKEKIGDELTESWEMGSVSCYPDEYGWVLLDQLKGNGWKYQHEKRAINSYSDNSRRIILCSAERRVKK